MQTLKMPIQSIRESRWLGWFKGWWLPNAVLYSSNVPLQYSAMIASYIVTVSITILLLLLAMHPKSSKYLSQYFVVGTTVNEHVK